MVSNDHIAQAVLRSSTAFLYLAHEWYQYPDHSLIGLATLWQPILLIRLGSHNSIIYKHIDMVDQARNMYCGLIYTGLVGNVKLYESNAIGGILDELFQRSGFVASGGWPWPS